MKFLVLRLLSCETFQFFRLYQIRYQKIGSENSIRFGGEYIWYRKKVSASFRFWVSAHTEWKMIDLRWILGPISILLLRQYGEVLTFATVIPACQINELSAIRLWYFLQVWSYRNIERLQGISWGQNVYFNWRWFLVMFENVSLGWYHSFLRDHTVGLANIVGESVWESECMRIVQWHTRLAE